MLNTNETSLHYLLLAPEIIHNMEILLLHTWIVLYFCMRILLDILFFEGIFNTLNGPIAMIRSNEGPIGT